MANLFTRRRAIAVFAATAGLPLLTASTPWKSANATGRALTWTGQALGAPASLVLNHHDESAARRLVERVVAEVSRLESVFSLYREDSSIAELNRLGVVIAPPEDMVSLLEACHGFWAATAGAFDPSVQPLWLVYRDHFGKPDAAPAGPSRDAIKQALERVGFSGVRNGPDRIAMRAGMALTLNGVAQGYITDRIVDLLRDAGVTSSLVDMGEDRAIGSRADGTPWRIGLAASEDSERPDQILDVVDKAVATSSASGFHFDVAEHFGHIIDPRDGAAPALYRRVSVVADDAATADAFSTAFTLMDERSIASAIRSRPDVTVDFVDASGVHGRHGKPIA